MGGATGVVMLGMVVSLVKTIITVIKFFIWNSKTKTIGKIVKYKDRIIKYRDEKRGKILTVEYLYTIEYEINGNKHQIGYKEKFSKDRPSKIQVGGDMPIYVDEKTLQIQNVKDLKNELIGWPLFFAGLSLILLVIILVMALISNVLTSNI